jgi:uncharacterized protein (TIGR02391 family)
VTILNLQTHISSELWESLASAYDSGNYSHAVLEAMHHLTTVLRERSGAEGDGVALVGQALGGDAPKLLINGFQSETERNVQRGLEQVLRGIYLSIRNPRSHEQMTDTQQDADAIIHFIDYILRILTSSKEAFTIESFMASISDTEFVESKRYAELLVAEVPTNRRGDALVALFKNRRTKEIRKLRYVVSTLLAVLSETQLLQYLGTVSDELRVATEVGDIRTALQMMTPELWPRIAETSRLRIENKLIREITYGEIQVGGKTTGSLGTWSNVFLKHFTLRHEAAEVLLAKLEDWDPDDLHYVAKYFLSNLPSILTEESERRRGIRAIAQAVEGDSNVRDSVIASVRSFPSVWQRELVEALQSSTDPSNPAVVLDDGVPFLSAPTAPGITDDDIPF